MTQRQEFSNSRVSQNGLNMMSGITAATMLFTRLPSLSNAFRPKRISLPKWIPFRYVFQMQPGWQFMGVLQGKLAAFETSRVKALDFQCSCLLHLAVGRVFQKMYSIKLLFFFSNFRQAKSNAGFRDVCYTDAQAKEQLQVDEVSRIG